MIIYKIIFKPKNKIIAKNKGKKIQKKKIIRPAKKIIISKINPKKRIKRRKIAPTILEKELKTKA